jgi:hypothetical protein
MLAGTRRPATIHRALESDKFFQWKDSLTTERPSVIIFPMETFVQSIVLQPLPGLIRSGN